MPDFKVRSQGIEMMDDLTCSGDVIDQTLQELEFINTWLGGNAVTLSGIKKLLTRADRKKYIVIADLGCGGGDMLKLVDHWAQRNGYTLTLKGYDANPNIIRYAQTNTSGNPRISFQTMDIFSEEFRRQKFDIVIGTLFYHHFTTDQLSEFFTQLKRQCSIGILINDIHRHPLAFYSIKWLTQWFSKSPMVKFDAPLSVLRAFHRQEIVEILNRATFDNYRIDWKWAFRWRVLAFSPESTEAKR
jgi:2-polyprenyl-3-methyl-5-hydroxy-6-metoxy-1,4-benzoquinol methylase